MDESCRDDHGLAFEMVEGGVEKLVAKIAAWVVGIGYLMASSIQKFVDLLERQGGL